MSAFPSLLKGDSRWSQENPWKFIGLFVVSRGKQERLRLKKKWEVRNDT